ncbi:MAG: hypothetical protein WC476_12995 [Phycisphaerae bacterium]
MEWNKIELTTGEILRIGATERNGESFDWLGQNTYANMEMEDVDGDSTYIKCLTPGADEIARSVQMLWDATWAGDHDRDMLWAAFTESETSAEFAAEIEKMHN